MSMYQHINFCSSCNYLHRSLDVTVLTVLKSLILLMQTAERLARNMFPVKGQLINAGLAIHYLWISKFALKRLPCHRPVISSVSFSVGSPDTVAKTIRVLPFLDIFRSSSGLEGSTLEKSMGGGDLLCSGRSPSSMSSSSCGPKAGKMWIMS